MKNVLVNTALLIIAAALFLGIYSYIKADDEPTKDDEIVDVMTEDEVEEEIEYKYTNILEYSFGFDDDGNPLPPSSLVEDVKYFDGITWIELIELNPNKLSKNGEYILVNGQSGYLCDGGGYFIILTDVVDFSAMYTLTTN